MADKEIASRIPQQLHKHLVTDHWRAVDTVRMVRKFYRTTIHMISSRWRTPLMGKSGSATTQMIGHFEVFM